MQKISNEDLTVMIREVQESRNDAYPYHSLRARDLQSILAELVKLRSTAAPKTAPVTVELSAEMITQIIQEEFQKLIRKEQQPGGLLCPGVKSDAEMIEGMAEASDSSFREPYDSFLDGYLHCVCELLRNQGNTDAAIEHASNLLVEVRLPEGYSMKDDTLDTLRRYGLLGMVK